MALVRAEHSLSERRACKLLGVDRTSYRYEPQPDGEAALRQELLTLARQKPRYGSVTATGAWVCCRLAGAGR